MDLGILKFIFFPNFMNPAYKF